MTSPFTVIKFMLLLMQTAILLRLVLSFFPLRDPSFFGSVRMISHRVTDPVVLPLRKALPPLPGAAAGFGLAELVVLFGLSILIGILPG